MTVHIPSPLQSYTHGQRKVDAQGASLMALLKDLDRQFPGIFFRMIDEQDRIRIHILFFVNTEKARDLSRPLNPTDEVHIICALSGGV